MLAALATLFTPVFLVSSLTVMCDVILLAFWVWAVVFWVEGTEQKNLWKLFVAGLADRSGGNHQILWRVSDPLRAAHSLINRRRVGQWAQCLLIPLAVLCAYQYLTQAAYGGSLLYRAMDYAAFPRCFLPFSKSATVWWRWLLPVDAGRGRIF